MCFKSIISNCAAQNLIFVCINYLLKRVLTKYEQKGKTFLSIMNHYLCAVLKLCLESV